MNKKIAFLFPGQGAQYPGMGHDFFEEFQEAKAVFQEADALLGEPFSELIFKGSKEELMLTKNSQLAIFITSVAILRVVESLYPGLKPVMCAGLSLGEYTALVASGLITFKEALPLVKARGTFMQQACESHPGTMQVVLGLELPIVKETIAQLKDVWIANLNCPGQIVISGSHDGVETAAKLLKERGAKRVLPLDVSGAFHSGLMQEAQDRLAPLIQSVDLTRSDVLIAMNAVGHFVADLEEIKTHMTSQVTHPVCWQSDIEAMVSMGVDLFIEMGPGKTLAGMNKRIGVKIPTFSIGKREELGVLGEKEVFDAIAQR